MVRIKSFFKENRGELISGVIGVLMFLFLFGFSAIDLTGYRLFSRGDPGAHYLGWRFFKDAVWQLKPGLMDNLNYPHKVSVVFTDSIPLLAVFFKIFRAIIPETFNYFGLWICFCFFMQGFWASKILGLKVKGRLVHWSGVLFFILTPAFIKRAFWHTALTAHFLLLISLYLLLKDDDKESTGKKIIFWGVLGFICGGIHLYFLGICGMVAVFTALDMFIRRKGWKSLLIPFVFGITGAFNVWILGGLDSGMAPGAPGFGYYSFNLNGFFNGYQWSRVLHLPWFQESQTEGFAYLGLGMLMILGFSAIFLLVRCFYIKDVIKRIRPAIVLLFIVSILFAASNRGTFSDRLLWFIDIDGNTQLKTFLEIFRSSGRFAWIDMYLLMAGGFYALEKIVIFMDGRKQMILGTIGETAVLILALIQIIDLWPGLNYKALDVDNTQVFDSNLTDPYWYELADSGKYAHVCMVDKGKLSQDQLYALAFYALDYHMTLNDFNFARALTYSTGDVAWDYLDAHTENMIYVFHIDSFEDATYYEDMDVKLADGMLVGVFY